MPLERRKSGCTDKHRDFVSVIYLDANKINLFSTVLERSTQKNLHVIFPGIQMRTVLRPSSRHDHNVFGCIWVAEDQRVAE
jgi:hypothetical protein